MIPTPTPQNETNCTLLFVENPDISGWGVIPIGWLFSSYQVRGSLYAQTAFAMFVFLPWSEDFSRSLFLSSFSLTLAFNVAFWTTLETTDSFYAVFMMGINLLLTAPISVSLARLSIAKHQIEMGFALCYLLFALIKLASLGICIDRAIVYDGERISSFASECKDYYGTLIAMITISTIQALVIIGITWPLYKRHKDPAPDAFTNVILWIGTVPVALAVVSLILLERMGSSASLSFTTPDAQNGSVTFAQVFAIAGSVGPLIELLKYLFTVQPADVLKDAGVPAEAIPVQGLSPLGYALRTAHLTDRTILEFTILLTYKDAVSVIVKINLWPFILWVIVTALVTSFYPVWIFAASIGMLILSATTGFFVFQSLGTCGRARACIFSITASVLLLVACILPLVSESLLLPWYASTIILGAIIAAAASHLMYLKLRRQPCRRMSYWYGVTVFMYGEVFVPSIVFVGFVGFGWVTTAIVLGVYCVYQGRVTARSYLGIVSLGLIIGASLSALPLALAAVGTWVGLVVCWGLGLAFILMEKGPRRRSKFRQRFMFAFCGRVGYATAQAETGGRRAKLRKALSILLENHAIKLPYQIRDPQDEVNVFINFVSNFPRLCGPLGYLYVVTSFLNSLYFTWFFPIISLVAGILISVTYNWPIPQGVALADPGNGAAVGQDQDEAAGDQMAGDRDERAAGGEGAVQDEMQLRDVGQSSMIGRNQEA